jgi:hypothetical protein
MQKVAATNRMLGIGQQKASFEESFSIETLRVLRFGPEKSSSWPTSREEWSHLGCGKQYRR